MPPTPEDSVLRAAGEAASVGYLPAEVIALFGEPISVYTRAQALADGVLVDITDRAHATYRQYRAFGSVAMTAAAYADTVVWTDTVENGKPQYTGQDETARLADVLWMALLGMRAAHGSDRAVFTMHRIPPTGRGITARPVRLQITLSGGDHAEPVLTIGFPGED